MCTNLSLGGPFGRCFRLNCWILTPFFCFHVGLPTEMGFKRGVQLAVGWAIPGGSLRKPSMFHLLGTQGIDFGRSTPKTRFPPKKKNNTPPKKKLSWAPTTPNTWLPVVLAPLSPGLDPYNSASSCAVVTRSESSRLTKTPTCSASLEIERKGNYPGFRACSGSFWWEVLGSVFGLLG